MAKSKVVPDTKETKTNSVIDVTEVQKDAKQDAAIENKRVAMIKEKVQVINYPAKHVLAACHHTSRIHVRCVVVI